MGFLSWALFGLIAGIVAKFILPGRDGGGLIATTLLGIVGAVVGGFAGTRLGWGSVTGFDLHSFGLAVGGGLVVLIVHRMLRS
ncbi:MAG: GlsB/YeaQ/YmgE family stress response membrane protein [Myxococcales bacterium]|nr:GlsB/YeaQ/YmgE family stress response membrane protein [Myxococcales bacterium]MBL0193702.1 GlsB/YeaQ/YmgE family stress response membrane protein [Myxococcales bacterium]HQY61028.1 GlsB/YeaQ/YmgE family stress response membrane protein [Polyangiaceae bacterium]